MYFPYSFSVYPAGSKRDPLSIVFLFLFFYKKARPSFPLCHSHRLLLSPQTHENNKPVLHLDSPLSLLSFSVKEKRVSERFVVDRIKRVCILSMEKRVLDFVLVPSGLSVMMAYHVWLLYRIVKHPTKTIVGVNAINRRFWVRAMMEVSFFPFFSVTSVFLKKKNQNFQQNVTKYICYIEKKNLGFFPILQDSSKTGVLAVQTLRNNIMASTLLASTAIMLSSLIAVLMTNGSSDRSAFFVFGDRSELSFSIKFFSILVCFLVAFLFNVQSIRYYSHASILINVPFKKMFQNHHSHHLTIEYVARNLNRGSYFWSLGLRAFYFSFPLFLWIFGPIPMFFSCFVLVFMLYFLDATFEFGWEVGVSDEDQPKDEELGR